MKKLPTIDIWYWLLIISANTMGETAGDLISQTFKLGYAGGTLALFVLFIIALLIAIFSSNEKPIVYWSVITLASTLGTTISDLLSRVVSVHYLGVSENTGYLYATLFLIVALFCTFSIWKHFAKDNSIENGLNTKTELLYWTAILTSSTLGTALGDLLAHNTPLGFGGSTLLLLALLVVVIFVYFFTNTSRTFLYWCAIVLTHPIGATIGDYLTKPEGFNLGNIWASALLVLVFVVIVVAHQLINKKYLKN